MGETPVTVTVLTPDSTTNVNRSSGFKKINNICSTCFLISFSADNGRQEHNYNRKMTCKFGDHVQALDTLFCTVMELKVIFALVSTSEKIQQDATCYPEETALLVSLCSEILLEKINLRQYQEADNLRSASGYKMTTEARPHTIQENAGDRGREEEEKEGYDMASVSDVLCSGHKLVPDRSVNDDPWQEAFMDKTQGFYDYPVQVSETSTPSNCFEFSCPQNTTILTGIPIG
ncbi:hypothetical protein llap_10957 [Limosa lapponica baueri]|uniref:Uncharacterized protein n=1 Tax=Limosa lapponica baueri TaxID=1758121 RepID=A0A2I0TY36_LIMLA|nr:hypothetical protein llap_10957 [Limosa lapponica baueri]